MSDYVITCILSSTLAATLITSIKELIIWALNRKAKKNDDNKEEKNELEEFRDLLKEQQEFLTKMTNTVSGLQKKLDIYLNDYKIILKDKIKYLVYKYLEIGEISIEEKQAIQHMWSTYHYDLEGNGDLDEIMEVLDKIPIKDLKLHIRK